MQQIKIEKRITEELDGIRKLAALLPPGKANALINKCNKISGYARKALGEVYGPRVQSRIAQMCNVYRLGGPDRRK